MARHSFNLLIISISQKIFEKLFKHGYLAEFRYYY